MKLFFVALIAFTFAAAFWSARDSDLLRQFTQPTVSAPIPIRFDNDVRTSTPGNEPARGAAGTRSGLRKCLRGTEVLYTDESCPAGTREQQVTGGAVTVMPSQPKFVTPRVPAAAASLPNARDLLLPSGEPNLREMHMERVIGK